MKHVKTRTLRKICKQFGPGRLPMADKNDIGAGYAAAAAAIVATLFYGAVISVPGVLGNGIEEAVAMIFFLLAIPFVVPAAFLVGFFGWRLLPSHSPPIGVLAGGLGAITSYIVATIFTGVLISVAAALSLTGADPVSAVIFSVGLGTVAFVLTWWVTIPIGCLTGHVYLKVVNDST